MIWVKEKVRNKVKMDRKWFRIGFYVDLNRCDLWLIRTRSCLVLIVSPEIDLVILAQEPAPLRGGILMSRRKEQECAFQLLVVVSGALGKLMFGLARIVPK
jgi:hypothetical protein